MRSVVSTAGYLGAGLLLATAVTACGGDSSGDPIVVGEVASVTGPLPFPEFSGAAAAYFDQVNAEGGIDGRQIEYIVEDDQGDPQIAAQAARRLVDQEEAVVLGGGASLVQCPVNAPYFEQRDILQIAGGGVGVVCFNTPNIAPMNVGPIGATEISLHFASEVLGDERPCVLANQTEGAEEGFTEAVQNWSDATGNSAPLTDYSITATDDVTPLVSRAAAEGCQAVTMALNDFQIVAVMQAARAQGVGQSIDWIGLSPAYTEEVGRQAEQIGIDLYASAEWEPWLDTASPALEEWRTLMDNAGIEQSAFAEGGFLAAQVIVEALRNVDGEITRESVNQSLAQLEWSSPMMGTPFAFSPDDDAHQPNQANKFVQWVDGGWTVVNNNEWITLPEVRG